MFLENYTYRGRQKRGGNVVGYSFSSPFVAKNVGIETKRPFVAKQSK
jgi:hypothetical protein